MNLFAVPLRGVGDSIRVAIDDLRTANVLIAKSYTKDTIIHIALDATEFIVDALLAYDDDAYI